jgi:hypothetical protein
MIRIGFSTSGAWIAKVIRWFTSSSVSHVFLLFSFAGREWVVEAGWNGVVIIPWSKFLRQNQVVKLIDIPDAYNLNLGDTLDMVGEPYDYRGLLGMTLVLVGRWLKRKWKNPTQSGRALFCSEMTVILLQKAGYPGAETLDPRETSPDDILRLLERQ